MFLTSEHKLGGNSNSGQPEDLEFIVKYCWASAKHMKEAIKIFLSSKLEDLSSQKRFEDNDAKEQIQVQIILASNPSTTPEVLNYLARHSDWQICERIALNPRAPEHTLDYLSNHPSFEVRAAVTENIYCSITTLYRLAKDEHPDVRYRLAENPHHPESILQELSADENPFVQTRAKETMRQIQTNTGNIISLQFQTIDKISKLKAIG